VKTEGGEDTGGKLDQPWARSRCSAIFSYQSRPPCLGLQGFGGVGVLGLRVAVIFSWDLWGYRQAE
jgi:hypothetical protein